MVSVDQIQRGVSRFADTELIPKMSGIQKWIFAAGVSVYMADAPTIVDKLKANKFVSALDLIKENGAVDIEKVYRHMKQAAQSGPAEIDLPMVGRITLTADDLDKLYSMIVQA